MQESTTKPLERHDSIFDASPTIDATKQGDLDDPFGLFSAGPASDGPASAGPASDGPASAAPEPVYAAIDKTKKRISAADMPAVSEADAWDSLA